MNQNCTFLMFNYALSTKMYTSGWMWMMNYDVKRFWRGLFKALTYHLSEESRNLMNNFSQSRRSARSNLNPRPPQYKQDFQQFQLNRLQTLPSKGMARCWEGSSNTYLIEANLKVHKHLPEETEENKNLNGVQSEWKSKTLPLHQRYGQDCKSLYR
jgi:hypothetical protein